MTDDDKPEFVAALAELAALKPGAALTAEQFSAWWNAMRHEWELVEFRAACVKLSRDCEFMPNPYHFQQLRKTAGQHSCAEAWTQVCDLVRAGTEAQRLQLPVRVQRVVRAMGGWRALEMAESATRHFREKRFAELWEELGDVEEARAALPSVAAKLTGPQPSASLLPQLARQS